MSYTILKNWELAEKNLTACLNTSWAVSAPHNTALVYFARGKQYQCQGLHDKAIVEFTGAIEEEPENAYAMFRRAWSYKVPHCLLTCNFTLTSWCDIDMHIYSYL